MNKKVFDPQIAKRSIVKLPNASQRANPIAPIVLNIAHAADEIIPWGTSVKGRDSQLRSFWNTEPILASAVYGMSTRTAVLDWEITGSDPTKPNPRNTILAAKQLLNNADRGRGWQRFIIKLLIDLYTQDNGAFIEVIRRENSPTSPVVGIAHLDSMSCFRTGDPETPVLYMDADGVYHEMKWYQVITLEDMPSPVETALDIQYCAVTRCLRAAQLIRDTSIYKKEKLSGKNPRAIHLVSGMTQSELDDARAWAEEIQKNQNLFRYVSPYILATINPEAALDHKQIDLASLPDGYDEESTFKWYITLIAMAFGADYQEFAPLPSGAMGSGQQSEILHLKARGKGPAAMINLIENTMNNCGILPATVKFQFKVEDMRADEGRANARFTRGKDRVLRVDSGELTIEGSIIMAMEDGDVPEWLGLQMLEEVRSRPEPEPPPMIPEPQEPNSSTELTATQVGNATEAFAGRPRGKAKTGDDARVEWIKRLQRRGDIVITDTLTSVTEEDVNEARGLLGKLRRLFGE